MQQLKDRLSSITRLSSRKNIDIYAGLGQNCLPILVVIMLSIFGYSTTLAQNSAQSEKSSKVEKKEKKEKKKLKDICITFDELPAAPGFGGVDVDAVSFLVLEGLKKHKVEAAGFIVGDQINGRHDLLGQWLNDGHTLGSMTYSNQDYHDLGITTYLREVRMGHELLEEMLSGFGQKRRYFRFPFLHSGMSEKGRKQAYMFLNSLNVEVVTATVLPEDYLYNLRLIKMGHEPDSAQFEMLLNEYINHVLDEIERCERVAKQLVGREIKQILLLQMNRLNAVYLDEMLGAIENMGYKFITVQEAMTDPIYAEEEAYFGTRRLGWLDRLLASEADLEPAR